MITIKNTHSDAHTLTRAIINSGVTPLIDLDGVLLDATHRQCTFTAVHVKQGLCQAADIGALNLVEYRKKCTPEHIAKDKALALLSMVHTLNACGIGYYVVTARVNCSSTAKLLKDKGINPLSCMARHSETDTRRDDHLKVDNLLAQFEPHELKNMVLIDDNLRNLKAVQAIGVRAIHVPFEGH